MTTRDAKEGIVTASTDARYRELPVHDALVRDLVCLWTLEVPQNAVRPYTGHVLPDACIDLVFFHDGSAIASGPATVGLAPVYEPGTVLVGARFRPGAAPGWVRENASALLNLQVPLEDVLGPVGKLWTTEVAAPQVLPLRLYKLERLLLERLHSVPAPDPVVAAGIRTIAADLADPHRHWRGRLGLSDRQLHRRFQSSVGYGPKTLERILRLQRLLAAASTSPVPPLASLAVWAGYSDQPHMSREVRALTDLTPTAVLGRDRGTLSLSDLFKTATSALD